MNTRQDIRSRRTPLFAAALAAALGVAACDSAERERLAGEVKEQAGVAAQTLDDAALTAKVKAALAADAQLAGAEISVETAQGKVTLSGRVTDPEQAEQAAQAARSVEGVQEVETRLTAGAAQG